MSFRYFTFCSLGHFPAALPGFLERFLWQVWSFFGIVILSLFVFGERIGRTSEVPGGGDLVMLGFLALWYVFDSWYSDLVVRTRVPV